MIIRKNPSIPVWTVRGVPSPVRKHVCAPEATPKEGVPEKSLLAGGRGYFCGICYFCSVRGRAVAGATT